MGKTSKSKMPDDFEWNGWCRNNNYGLNKEDFPDKSSYIKERWKRALKVMNQYQKTDEYKRAISVVLAEKWEERAAQAHRTSDTTEVLLLEALTKREDGITTSELVASCINVIARELAKRGVDRVEELELKDLVTISNTLIGLTKAAAATKKEQGWMPNTQINNITVNNSSKTGGVIGGLQDIIDVEAKK